jgi:hypothetical protein
VTGFALGASARPDSNVARSCVAVDVGGSETGGFSWTNGNEGVWGFRDCVAHNNNGSGILVWQNTSEVHTIEGFIGYHNDLNGISHGAYTNPYRYQACRVVANGQGGIGVNAVSSRGSDGRGLEFTDLYCDAGGTAYGVQIDDDAPVDADQPILLQRATFTGSAKAAIHLTADQQHDGNNPVDVIDCSFDGNEFWLDSDVVARSAIEVRDRTHGAIVLRRADQSGTLERAWNAAVTPA